MFGQFDRRSPSFINLGRYHTWAGSTAAFDALTCENAGRARWWGGVMPMGAFGRRTTRRNLLLEAAIYLAAPAGDPDRRGPVGPGLGEKSGAEQYEHAQSEG